jgi:hypothetical protein
MLSKIEAYYYSKINFLQLVWKILIPNLEESSSFYFYLLL